MNNRKLQDAHVLLPQALAETIPPLYATQGQADPMARVKWFTPDGGWTWFVIEFDPAERLCFGYVIGQDREFGYFSLDDVESVRGPLGLRVERDLYWEPKPISQCK